AAQPGPPCAQRARHRGGDVVSVVATLAAAPALPLDEAGKYVAGAFVAFVAVILIYVAIMAAKLQRMGRELAELNAELNARQHEQDGER
ncbi:MAG: hypothetical protein WBC33_09310, partial [Conexibacter sp.]